MFSWKLLEPGATWSCVERNQHVKRLDRSAYVTLCFPDQNCLPAAVIAGGLSRTDGVQPLDSVMTCPLVCPLFWTWLLDTVTGQHEGLQVQCCSPLLDSSLRNDCKGLWSCAEASSMLEWEKMAGTAVAHSDLSYGCGLLV